MAGKIDSRLNDLEDLVKSQHNMLVAQHDLIHKMVERVDEHQLRLHIEEERNKNHRFKIVESVNKVLEAFGHEGISEEDNGSD